LTGNRIVAVVGAGHVTGIVKNLQIEQPLEPLEQVPPRSRLVSAIGWFLPLMLLALLIYGFVHTGAKAWTNVWIWILATGSLSALGAIAAMAHPLAILTAFVVAPFTTLHPLLAAGWFAGLVQAWIRTPKVEDLEELPNSTSTIKGFWTNPAIKILLVTALTNLGGSLGLALALAWVGARSI
jgi:pheromone shutdown protein TraB